ncbi:MAG: hypothetical protein FWD13_11615 [Treponema sp.]|nr:hypothetical protein [Treponema sp.]
MKKTMILCCILTVIFVLNISAQQLGDIYTERSAGFTMAMPAGWQTQNFNQKYLSIVGPQDRGLTPNIGFADEDYSGPTSGYIDAALGLFPVIFSDFTLLNRSTFTTDSGIVGETITYRCTMGSIQVRQKMYVFPNRRGTSVMIISCTAPSVNGERYDPIFDASVKTFNWTARR